MVYKVIDKWSMMILTYDIFCQRKSSLGGSATDRFAHRPPGTSLSQPNSYPLYFLKLIICDLKYEEDIHFLKLCLYCTLKYSINNNYY